MSSTIYEGQVEDVARSQTSPPKSTTNANLNASGSNTGSGSSKPAVQRHRASIACASCRDRRIRCVVPPGENECTQCKRSKTECVIKNDDERRRPISKAYMSSLTDRVAMLEGLLQESGKDIPPADYPPKIRADTVASQQTTSNTDNPPNQNAPPPPQNTTPRSLADDSTDGGENGYQNDNNMSNSVIDSHPAPRISASKKEGLVHMLLSTRGHLSFDQLSGRLRFFGPASNFHIYADNNNEPDLRESPEQVRRTERIIRSLTIETHDYLMNLFWEYYNSVLHIVHKDAFNEEMQCGNNKYYSGFLHISILAMGYRFADLEREDMRKITLGNRECTLHREAKYMMDMELERPGGIPSVQAFLLLGDLECGVGRDNTGWMYAGMANRLCFDLGLHLDCQNDGLPEKEIQIRHMTLFACVIYDKYWALFLGRPTGIKSQDLEMYRLSHQFASLTACKPAGVQKSLETQIYEELLDLMELAGKIAEIRDNPTSHETQDVDKANAAYLYVMNLDRQLQTWYRRLPDNLVWKPENIQTAPFSFFLLHQQYHCSLILLHRPWAKYEDPTPPSSDDGYAHPSSDDSPDLDTTDNHSFLSRSICTRQAIRVSRIFWRHRQRFDTRRIFVTGIQHAGTAATALVAALAFIKNVNDRKNNMQYLECLANALGDMSYTYQPAASMSSILRAVMVELREADRKTPPPDFRSDFGRGSGSVLIPVRRESTNDNEDLRTFKKRQLSKPSSSRPTNMFALTPAPVLQQTFAPTPASNPLAFPLDNNSSAGEGYVVITPRSERAAWPSLNGDLNALDYPMAFTGMSGMGTGATPLTWLGDFGDAGVVAGGMGSGNGGGMGEDDEGEGGERRRELDFFSF
ncbi:fungal-specific transcription factor domain-containing protein [Amylocarpus encephaloides]|uniref:Fungal-specific transcription factor domain-containing protein n=1 Tax=Amylocarpus encephaloides TaxID=45428 RepID=A0A9P8C6D8_9HELO|nr:fungal-specific transcription factor domain-containing protein [Amylocarpus encephaloides]